MVVPGLLSRCEFPPWLLWMDECDHVLIPSQLNESTGFWGLACSSRIHGRMTDFAPPWNDLFVRDDSFWLSV